MGISFQEEPFENIATEMDPLFIAQWEELANNKDIRPISVSKDKYIALNRMNVLKAYTIRDEGILIGYAFFIVDHHIRYVYWKYAISDIYYIISAFRGQGLGKDFFLYIQDQLKLEGVRSIVIHDQITHSREKFFTALGFNPIEQVYEKIL